MSGLGRTFTPSASLPLTPPLTPCLIFHEEMDGLYKFFDPLSKRVYAANILELHGASFHFSKGSWLLVSANIASIFSFNPFTKERIDLPNLPGVFSAISFSSLPTSPDCVVFAVINCKPYDGILIRTCSPGAQSWANGLFYCPGQQGNLGVYNIIEDTWNVLKNPMPLELPMGHCFLIEFNGELLLVYHLRTQIHIFSLDKSKMVWDEVVVLEDVMLFLSRSTSVAMMVNKEGTATSIRDMKNKIYIARFCLDYNDALVYHIESKSHYIDFYKSKEFINCTWIDPTGFEFALDSQGNILSVTSRFR
ncbi:hypothetical protein AAC387_Pa07g3267 [Persea americana]